MNASDSNTQALNARPAASADLRGVNEAAPSSGKGKETGGSACLEPWHGFQTREHDPRARFRSKHLLLLEVARHIVLFADYDSSRGWSTSKYPKRENSVDDGTCFF